MEAASRVRELLSQFTDSSQDDENENTNSPDGTPKKSHSDEPSPQKHRDRSSFIHRLQTFTPANWFGKPASLTPDRCASRGWENTAENQLQCVTCKAYMNAKLPDTYEPGVYDECLQKVEGNLVSSHKESCPWRVNSESDSGIHVWLSREQALEEYKKRVTELLQLKEALPATAYQQMDTRGAKMEDLLRCAASSTEISDSPAHHRQAALILALAGWTAKFRSAVLKCEYCQRQLGTWNYRSVESEVTTQTSTSEDTTVSAEQTDGGETATAADDAESAKDDKEEEDDLNLKLSPSPKAKKQKILEPVDPIAEHNYWCHWVKESEESEISQGSPSKSKPSGPGWLQFLHQLLPQVSGSPAAQALTPPHEGVRSIQRTLQTWESPRSDTREADR